MDLRKISSAFIQELLDSSSGKATSLRFLKTNISSAQIPDGETFQVLIVGGSVFISAKVRKNGSRIAVINKETSQIPDFIDVDIFLSFISKYIDKKTQYVSLNFAFPLESILRNNIIDGKLLSATKMYAFKGLVGKNVGETLENHIKIKTGQKIHVSAANDTVCLLLAGLSVAEKDSLGCLVVGTGYNSAFFLDENTIVNLEAAGFDKFAASEAGIWLDQQTKNATRSKFEKEVAGAYLYRHFNFFIKQKSLDTPEILSTKELSEIAQTNLKESVIARDLLHKSAQLVATHLAGIAEFKKKDMVFIAEGSLFWKGYEYKQTVEKTLKTLTSYKIKLVEIKDSSIIGAAKLFDMS